MSNIRSTFRSATWSCRPRHRHHSQVTGSECLPKPDKDKKKLQLRVEAMLGSPRMGKLLGTCGELLGSGYKMLQGPWRCQLRLRPTGPSCESPLGARRMFFTTAYIAQRAQGLEKTSSGQDPFATTETQLLGFVASACL